MSHSLHALIFVLLQRDCGGYQVHRDSKESWEKQYVLSIAGFDIEKKSVVYCTVLHRAAIWLQCVTQGRSGMDGGRGIPGDPGSKVKYVFIDSQWSFTKKFCIYCI